MLASLVRRSACLPGFSPLLHWLEHNRNSNWSLYSVSCSVCTHVWHILWSVVFLQPHAEHMLTPIWEKRPWLMPPTLPVPVCCATRWLRWVALLPEVNWCCCVPAAHDVMQMLENLLWASGDDRYQNPLLGSDLTKGLHRQDQAQTWLLKQTNVGSWSTNLAHPGLSLPNGPKLPQFYIRLTCQVQCDLSNLRHIWVARFASFSNARRGGGTGKISRRGGLIFFPPRFRLWKYFEMPESKLIVSTLHFFASRSFNGLWQLVLASPKAIFFYSATQNEPINLGSTLLRWVKRNKT